jgi:cell wall-associated NlpC family hydrolase
VAAAATVVGLVVATGPSASADPKHEAAMARIEQVEAQVESLQNDAANAQELVNDAENKLAAIKTKMAALKVKLVAAQAAVGEASESVDAMARAAYTSGGTDTMLQAMLADDPTQFLERAATLDAVARIGNADLRRSQAARVALAQVKTEIAQQQAAAAAAAKQAADQRAYIHKTLAEAQALVSRLKVAEQKRLAEIREARRQAAIKAAQEAAAQQRAEAAARRASSSSGSSSGSGSYSGGSSGGSAGYSSSRAQIAVQAALAQVGEPYSYNAHPPSSWDCSKLTAWAWAQAGVSLTAYSYTQYQQTRRISRDELRPGDLLFYFGMGAHHVAMYIGNGRIVHAANPSRGVEVSSAWGPWYGERYSGAGRVV